MEANELRIGNIINTISTIDGSEIQVAVWSIYENLINGVDNNQFKPIQLTEEWLLKLGFEYNGSLFVKDYIKIGYVNDDFVHYQYTLVINNFFIKIKYVHRLQNLYFELKNEELKYKL